MMCLLVVVNIEVAEAHLHRSRGYASQSLWPHSTASESPLVISPSSSKHTGGHQLRSALQHVEDDWDARTQVDQVVMLQVHEAMNLANILRAERAVGIRPGRHRSLLRFHGPSINQAGFVL
jgi:hypothetical protein